MDQKNQTNLDDSAKLSIDMDAIRRRVAQNPNMSSEDLNRLRLLNFYKLESHTNIFHKMGFLDFDEVIELFLVFLVVVCMIFLCITLIAVTL